VKPRGGSGPERSWASRFLRGLLVWAVPVILAWILLTPFYNRFLTVSAERLLRLGESPAATALPLSDRHFALVTRSDLSAARGYLHRIRVTDIHFNWLMLGAFFLAVPGVAPRRKAGNLGWAALATVFFHIVSLFLFVKFVYATQLGSWSLAQYGPVAREVWGMAKHVFDLPLKFAWPFLLWAGFYFTELVPPDRPR